MLSGRYEHTIDSKGRTSIPVRLREELSRAGASDRLIVTSYVDPCLMTYPVTAWQAIEAQLAAKDDLDPEVMDLKRVFLSGAIECPIDKNGRILIPPVLREFAGLDKDVVWAGQGKHIEIWSKANWEEHFRQARERMASGRGRLKI